MAELVEGVDYYVENGRYVFTAAYHLARGHCCESGCRHCPYRPRARPDGAMPTGPGSDGRQSDGG